MTEPCATRPARSGVYHGTKVLIAIFLAGFMVYGGGLYSFVLFVPRLTEQFHWGRAGTTGLVSAFWLSAPLILLGGSAIKCFGALRLLITGILIEAVFVASLAGVSKFWQLYLLRVAMGFGKVMFAVTLPYIVSRWFSRRYLFALGIAWSGWSFGGLVLAPITGEVIARYGWRVACLAIAAGLLTIGLIPILTTLRFRSPQELGLGLDGDRLVSAAPYAGVNDPSPAGVGDVPLGSIGELVRSVTFWLLALGTVSFYMTYGVLLTHEAAVVEGAGFSPRLASLVLGSTAGVGGVGSLIVGWLLDRYPIRMIGIALHLLLLGGAISLLLVDGLHAAPALVTYAALFGFVTGSCDVYFVAVLRQRFPNVSLAYSFSAFYFCEIVTLVLAGPAAGRLFDLTGNYAVTLTLAAGSVIVASVFSFLVSGTVKNMQGNESRREVSDLP